MVEHVNIQDADRHEVRGASTAGLNQVLMSNGDGSTSFRNVSYDQITGTPVSEGYAFVLSGASSAASQQPVSLDTALQIEFGSGVVTPDATLGPDGTLTFNTAGDYLISVFMRFGRLTSGGVAIIFNRFLINDVQNLNSNSVKLPDSTYVIPFSATIGFRAEAGDTYKQQIMRDSAGTNAGGLFQQSPTTLPWALSPSATIAVSKYVGHTT